MGPSLISKIFYNCSAPEVRVKRSSRKYVSPCLFFRAEGGTKLVDRSQSFSSWPLETRTREARESEIQEVESRRENGTEVVESKDDIWALSADFTCSHHETDQITMLRTKKPSRCQANEKVC